MLMNGDFQAVNFDKVALELKPRPTSVKACLLCSPASALQESGQIILQF